MSLPSNSLGTDALFLCCWLTKFFLVSLCATEYDGACQARYAWFMRLCFGLKRQHSLEEKLMIRFKSFSQALSEQLFKVPSRLTSFFGVLNYQNAKRRHRALPVNSHNALKCKMLHSCFKGHGFNTAMVLYVLLSGSLFGVTDCCCRPGALFWYRAWIWQNHHHTAPQQGRAELNSSMGSCWRAFQTEALRFSWGSNSVLSLLRLLHPSLTQVISQKHQAPTGCSAVLQNYTALEDKGRKGKYLAFSGILCSSSEVTKICGMPSYSHADGECK